LNIKDKGDYKKLLSDLTVIRALHLSNNSEAQQKVTEFVER